MSGRTASTITCPHCHRAIAPLPVRIHLALVELDEAAKKWRESPAHDVLARFESSTLIGCMSIDELCEITAADRRAVTETLSALKRLGRAANPARGWWRAT